MAPRIGNWILPLDRDRYSLQELAATSDVILVGEITGISVRNLTHKPFRGIYTNYRFALSEVIKGTSRSEAWVEMFGGTLEDTSTMMAHAPRLEPRKHYVLFLKADDRLACPVIGYTQGVFIVGEDLRMKDSEGRLLTWSTGKDTIARSFSRCDTDLGSASTMPVSLSEFSSWLRGR